MKLGMSTNRQKPASKINPTRNTGPWVDGIGSICGYPDCDTCHVSTAVILPGMHSKSLQMLWKYGPFQKRAVFKSRGHSKKNPGEEQISQLYENPNDHPQYDG